MCIWALQLPRFHTLVLQVVLEPVYRCPDVTSVPLASILHCAWCFPSASLQQALVKICMHPMYLNDCILLVPGFRMCTLI